MSSSPEKSLYNFDKKNFSAHIFDVAGIDEAGRGPLAGPVVAAAVILDHKKRKIRGLDDSKKLSPQKREELFNKITERAAAVGVGISSVGLIDSRGILYALFKAARKAVRKLKVVPHLAVFDGNIPIPRLGISQKTLIRGDGKSACIAAASIVAKVTRDRLMKQLAQKHPHYGFEKHKGYGTAAHYEAIKLLGLTKHHRRSFLKEYIRNTSG